MQAENAQLLPVCGFPAADKKRFPRAPCGAGGIRNHQLTLSVLLARILDRSLRSSEARDRHAERRAGNVGQACVVAELDGARVAAVLAADAELDVRSRGLAKLASHLDQLADANLIELCERIVLVDLLVVVRIEDCLLYTSRCV